jgi:serine acetyltransferase
MTTEAVSAAGASERTQPEGAAVARSGRGRLHAAGEQFRFLCSDVARFPRPMGSPWLTCWAEPSFVVVLVYRITRALCLLLGPAWPAARLLLAPLAFALRPWLGRCEIHPMAAIGPGLYLLHPSLGVVISGHAVIGARLTLFGGNCIGARAPMLPGELIVEDDVTLGINSVVLGPIHVGRGATLGAGAVLIRDTPPEAVVGGVPARVLRSNRTD